MIKAAAVLTAGVAGLTIMLAATAPAEGSSASQGPAPAHNGRPVLVELYQSQGCSSCPPANANLNAIADRPDVVALSFAVTYWDDLGWKDTFASPQFTARQWDYAHHYRRGNVATPQVWINGRATIVGSDPRQLAAAIAASRGAGPTLDFSGDGVRVGAGGNPGGGAELWVARYDPRTLQVPIRAGENSGRKLPHKNVVRQLVRVGHWDGSAKSFPLPPSQPGLATAVFLQAGKGGPVLAAAKHA